MGRGVEEGILGHILEQAKKEGVSKVVGQYIPTNKNKPCEDFYQKCGFEKEIEDTHFRRLAWTYDKSSDTNFIA